MQMIAEPKIEQPVQKDKVVLSNTDRLLTKQIKILEGIQFQLAILILLIWLVAFGAQTWVAVTHLL